MCLQKKLLEKMDYLQDFKIWNGRAIVITLVLNNQIRFDKWLTMKSKYLSNEPLAQNNKGLTSVLNIFQKKL